MRGVGHQLVIELVTQVHRVRDHRWPGVKSCGCGQIDAQCGANAKGGSLRELDPMTSLHYSFTVSSGEKSMMWDI